MLPLFFSSSSGINKIPAQNKISPSTKSSETAVAKKVLPTSPTTHQPNALSNEVKRSTKLMQSEIDWLKKQSAFSK